MVILGRVIGFNLAIHKWHLWRNLVIAYKTNLKQQPEILRVSKFNDYLEHPHPVRSVPLSRPSIPERRFAWRGTDRSLLPSHAPRHTSARLSAPRPAVAG